MRIVVNGESREVSDGTTISALLVELDIRPAFCAVERNRELVPRGQHAECVLADADELEVVTLVGGG